MKLKLNERLQKNHKDTQDGIGRTEDAAELFEAMHSLMLAPPKAQTTLISDRLTELLGRDEAKKQWEEFLANNNEQ